MLGKSIFKVEIKQSVKFKLFSKWTSTLIKKLYNKHYECNHLKDKKR